MGKACPFMLPKKIYHFQIRKKKVGIVNIVTPPPSPEDCFRNLPRIVSEKLLQIETSMTATWKQTEQVRQFTRPMLDIIVVSRKLPSTQANIKFLFQSLERARFGNKFPSFNVTRTRSKNGKCSEWEWEMFAKHGAYFHKDLFNDRKLQRCPQNELCVLAKAKKLRQDWRYYRECDYLHRPHCRYFKKDWCKMGKDCPFIHSRKKSIHQSTKRKKAKEESHKEKVTIALVVLWIIDSMTRLGSFCKLKHSKTPIWKRRETLRKWTCQ